MSLFDLHEAGLEPIFQQIGKIIIGKRDSVEKAMIALLCGGHVLLEDVPGVGKTMLVRALAKTFDCDFKRVQCTSDLLPSDLTGVSIYSQKRGEFEFRPGPLFANMVLADELNRTSPKTQAAVLEAMAEKQVTVDGVTYRLPEPFLLLATQNPIDYEGTYHLPEAQLDRFMVRIRLGYPDRAHELDMLTQMQHRHPIETLRPMILKEELVQLQRRIRTIHVDETLKMYIVEIIAATRQHAGIALGASPRASLALMMASQAKAFLSGRRYVIPDDIKAMVESVLSHRLIVKRGVISNDLKVEAILREIMAKTAVPGLHYASGASGGFA